MWLICELSWWSLYLTVRFPVIRICSTSIMMLNLNRLKFTWIIYYTLTSQWHQFDWSMIFHSYSTQRRLVPNSHVFSCQILQYPFLFIHNTCYKLTSQGNQCDWDMIWSVVHISSFQIPMVQMTPNYKNRLLRKVCLFPIGHIDIDISRGKPVSLGQPAWSA